MGQREARQMIMADDVASTSTNTASTTATTRPLHYVPHGSRNARLSTQMLPAPSRPPLPRLSSTSFISLPAAVSNDISQLLGATRGEKVETSVIGEASAIGTASNSSAPSAYSKRRTQANSSRAGFRCHDHYTPTLAHPPPRVVLQQVPSASFSPSLPLSVTFRIIAMRMAWPWFIKQGADEEDYSSAKSTNSSHTSSSSSQSTPKPPLASLYAQISTASLQRVRRPVVRARHLDPARMVQSVEMS